MSELSGGVLEQLAKGGFYVPSAGDSGLSGAVVGDFELVRLLANGATSDVWEGVNRITHEPVAVKIACRSGAAIMRRFTFKLEFDYLDDAGKRSFFERMFKTKLTDDEFADLKTLQNLAPGDFRTVRQKTFYLNVAQTNADRIAALREECLLKRDGRPCRPIGFAV